GAQQLAVHQLRHAVQRREEPDEDEHRAAPHERGARSSSDGDGAQDRKSTRLNSSHVSISYAVFCLKKKNRLGRGRSCIKLSIFLSWILKIELSILLITWFIMIDCTLLKASCSMASSR